MELDNEWEAWEEEQNNQETNNLSAQYNNAGSCEDDIVPTNSYCKLADKTPPKSSDLSISTKSKKVLLNRPVNLEIFWEIPLVSYDEFVVGVIKKQIRSTSTNTEEYERFKQKKMRASQMPNCSYLREVVVKHMDVQKGTRHLFNNLTMVSVGISSKDILKCVNKQKKHEEDDDDSPCENENSVPISAPAVVLTKKGRGRPSKKSKEEEEEEVVVSSDEKIEVCSKENLKRTKQVFMNCFVLTIRLKSVDDLFHEYHIKVFNSGRISFVGVKDDDVLQTLFRMVMRLIKQFDATLADCSEEASDYEHVKILVNSKFNCGYCIHQENLCKILLKKYDMNCIYSRSNQYSGLRSKFYYDLTKSSTEQTGIYYPPVENGKDVLHPQSSQHRNKTAKLVSYPSHIVRVSYSIFRTGNALISGKCDDEILNVVYNFVVNLLKTEYPYLYEGEQEIKATQTKKMKRVWKLIG